MRKFRPAGTNSAIALCGGTPLPCPHLPCVHLSVHGRIEARHPRLHCAVRFPLPAQAPSGHPMVHTGVRITADLAARELHALAVATLLGGVR